MNIVSSTRKARNGCCTCGRCRRASRKIKRVRVTTRTCKSMQRSDACGSRIRIDTSNASTSNQVRSRPISRVLCRPEGRWRSFLWTIRRRTPQAIYPGTRRAAVSFPYLILLRVGFAVPCGVSPARGALLPHRFTLATRILRCRSAVCSLLHFPSARAAQTLSGTLPYGARTFLDALACTAIAWPTPLPIVVARAAHAQFSYTGGAECLDRGAAAPLNRAMNRSCFVITTATSMLRMSMRMRGCAERGAL